MRMSLAIAVLLIGGCATQSWEPIDNTMRARVGKPLDDAIAVLGMPTSERNIAGRKAYVWTTDGTAALPVGTSTQHFGSAAGVSYMGTSSGITVAPARTNCEIVLIVNDQSVVTNWSYDGNLLGCSKYVSGSH